MPTIIFNKPYGVLSQFTDEGTGHPTLKDYINVPGVYAAGRLDRESEGLLLLTDDGGLQKYLSDPKYHVEKTYWVLVEGEPETEALRRLENGIRIKGYMTKPAKARILSDPGLPARSKPVTPHGPTSWLEIKLREGKNRQVRRMTAAVSLFTLRLVRVAIGPINWDGLGAGEWRQLSKKEMRSLRE